MKLLRPYLRQHRRTIVTYALFCGVFTVSFCLYQLPLSAVAYPMALCALAGLGILTWDFLRVREKHRELTAMQAHCTTLLSELPRPESIGEADCQQLLTALREQMLAQQNAAVSRYRDMMEYYTVWVHQIKTPIASMRLTLQNEDSALSRRLSLELLRIEQYVDMVLAYLRLDAPTNDFVLRTCALDGIVRRSIKRFATEFIEKRLKLNYEPAAVELVTDEKWLGFVIDQLLSNALKYTQEGGVHIYLEGQTLCIADSGIGIAPEDLPRVFEKGYTGYNGRRDSHATGIGLYLCRRVCKSLGVGLSATSELGKGTTMRLDLSQHPIQPE